MWALALHHELSYHKRNLPSKIIHRHSVVLFAVVCGQGNKEIYMLQQTLNVCHVPILGKLYLPLLHRCTNTTKIEPVVNLIWLWFLVGSDAYTFIFQVGYSILKPVSERVETVES